MEQFIRDRVVTPWKLGDIFPESEAVSPTRRDRVPTRYLGIGGHWTRYWSSTDAPIYPFLKGSGGLFSTAGDYARFLQLWMDREAGDGSKVLSEAAFARGLTPASLEIMSTGFPGAVVDYGQMWMLYRPRNAPEEIFAFGHGGSDGTHAYASP